MLPYDIDLVRLRNYKINKVDRMNFNIDIMNEHFSIRNQVTYK